MSFLDALPFDRLLWLVPIFFTLHNMEEAPFMEAWSKRLPLKLRLTISTRQFIAAVTFLTLTVFLITYYAVNHLRTAAGYLLVLEIQAILFFNAFIPHLGSVIRFRMYSPGVVTAVLLTIPFSIYLFRRALNEGIGTTAWWASSPRPTFSCSIARIWAAAPPIEGFRRQPLILAPVRKVAKVKAGTLIFQSGRTTIVLSCDNYLSIYVRIIPPFAKGGLMATPTRAFSFMR